MIAAETFPWELVGGGGAALAVIFIVIRLTTSHNETTKSITTEFANTVKDANTKNKCLAESFTETVTVLSREARTSHEECQRLLHEVLRDQIPRRHRATDNPPT